MGFFAPGYFEGTIKLSPVPEAGATTLKVVAFHPLPSAA
ncbi:MAG: hypothetical protein RL324_403 [Verrucomicrobiota bacterium]